MANWKALIKKYEGKDIVVVVHLGYNRGLMRKILDQEIELLGKLEFPKIEIISGKRYLNFSEKVDSFPMENELTGKKFGKVFVCGSQKDRCIPRIEAALKNHCEKIIRLTSLIH
ncbi:MAG: hypothetical protein CMH63_00065 [Nanoarchaeota archaeon]|jgi:hypothetical protein|nr:hypothetical protein [Nanoarchaeota archaeon]|tara:strand:- start:2331 stop:2672 length:342 start_codon:yes stop_codon:yes gene_type:complete